MKWNKFTLKTTTQATDLVSGVLIENGIDGVEIQDNIPLSEEDKKKISCRSFQRMKEWHI